MATPNYGYEKRQKELAKKRKKEEKLKAKVTRKQGDGADLSGGDAPLDEASGTPASDTPDASAPN